MQYKSTNTTVYSAKYHIVWCPKYRRALLSGHLAGRLRELIVDIVEDRGGEVLGLEIMPDHVHLLAEVPPQIALSGLMQSLKGQTSRVLRSEYPRLLSTRSLWTPSWFLSTVGGAPLARRLRGAAAGNRAQRNWQRNRPRPWHCGKRRNE